MLFKQRREEERLPVDKQDVGVPRDNSLVVAVPIETKKSVPRCCTNRDKKGISEKRIFESLSLKTLL
jgi:hypothetical protein